MFGYTAKAMDVALQENVAFSFRRLGLAAWSTLRNHGQIAARNRTALICLCATFAVVLWFGVYSEMRQVIGYLFAETDRKRNKRKQTKGYDDQSFLNRGLLHRK